MKASDGEVVGATKRVKVKAFRARRTQGHTRSALLWMVRSGACWRDLPKSLDPPDGQTALLFLDGDGRIRPPVRGRRCLSRPRMADCRRYRHPRASLGRREHGATGDLKPFEPRLSRRSRGGFGTQAACRSRYSAWRCASPSGLASKKRYGAPACGLVTGLAAGQGHCRPCL